MPLEGFEAFPFTHAGATRDVYRRGSGPGVVVIHEIPGITPEVARFGRRHGNRLVDSNAEARAGGGGTRSAGVGRCIPIVAGPTVERAREDCDPS